MKTENNFDLVCLLFMALYVTMNTYFKISIGHRLPCIIVFRLIYIKGLSLFYWIHYISANARVTSHPLKFSYNYMKQLIHA